MRPSRLIRTVLCLLVLSTAAAFAELDIAAHIPKEAKLIAHIDLAALRKSPLATQLIVQNAQAYGQFTEFLSQNVGINVNDLQSAWLISAQKDTFVLVLRGSFDADKIDARFGALPNVTPLRRDDCRFAASYTEDKKPGEKLAAVLDDSTLILGDRPSAERYLDILDNPASMLSASDPAVVRLTATDHALTATMRGDLSTWKGFDATVARVTEAIWITGDVGQHIDLQADVLTHQSTQAQGIAEVAHGFALLKGPELGDKPLLQSVLATLVASHAGNTATFKVHLDGDELQQRLSNR